MKKQLLLSIGLIGLFIILISLLKVNESYNYTVGGDCDIQYTTLGTITEIKGDGLFVVRVHNKEEDYNYDYKRVLHYPEYSQITLSLKPSDAAAGYEIGDVLSFSYFASYEDKSPLPIWSVDVLGKENPNNNISRKNFVSAEGVILEIDNEFKTLTVQFDLEDGGTITCELSCDFSLPEPGDYFQENQVVKVYYEPTRRQTFPTSIFIGSYEEQIHILE